MRFVQLSLQISLIGDEGIPHRADADDVYDEYFIPKGSTVLGNIWAIHMDPQRYPNPFAFDPDRFYRPQKPHNWASGPDATDRDQCVQTSLSLTVDYC